jgi:hypothetical protein
MFRFTWNDVSAMPATDAIVTNVLKEESTMSNKNVIQTEENPHIVINECAGSLSVKGWSKLEVSAQGSEVNVNETKEGIVINSRSTLALNIPTDASLEIRHCRGNLSLKNVHGSLEIGEVNGSTSIKNGGGLSISGSVNGSLSVRNIDGDIQANRVMGSFSVRNIHDLNVSYVAGDLSARNIEGLLNAQRILGDGSFRNVEGDVTVNQVGGDLSLRGINGLIRAENVGGDASLQGGLAAGKHAISAGGDIRLKWTGENGLTLAIDANEVINKLPIELTKNENGEYSGVIGSGEAFLNLEAGGDVTLTSTSEKEGFDMRDFDFNFDVDLDMDIDQFQEQIQHHMDHFTDLSQKFQHQFGPEFSERVSRQAERAVERAMRKLEKTQERMARRYGSPPPPRPPRSPGPPEPQASSEEQVKILKMLENGVISVDEANTLLDALES